MIKKQLIKLLNVLIVVCMGYFSAMQAHAQVPHALVEETVQVLVKQGVPRTPELVSRITAYYVEVARTSGVSLKPVMDNTVVLTYAQGFVTTHPGLFSPRQAKELQEQLNQLTHTLPQNRPSVSSLAARIEQVARKAAVGEVEDTSVPDRILTGREVLQQFIPGWREQLSGIFDQKRLALIKLVLDKTDEQFFKIENGQVVFKSSGAGEEWNYLEQFEIELRWVLQEQNLTLTDRQWKYLVGGSGIRNAPLVPLFRLLSLECFVSSRGTLPLTTADNPAEKSLALAISSMNFMKDKDSPLARLILAFKEKYSHAGKGVENRWHELVEFYDKHHRLPAFRSEYPQEDALARAITRIRREGDPDNEFVQKIIDFYEEHRPEKKGGAAARLWEAQQFLALYNRVPSNSKQASNEERSLARALHSIKHSGNPANKDVQQITRLLDENRSHAPIQSREARLRAIKAFYQEKGRLPSRSSDDPAERGLADAIHGFMAREGNGEDATLREIITFVKEHRVQRNSPQAWWEELQRFYAEKQRLPSTESADPDEHSLARAIHRLKAQKNVSEGPVLEICKFVQQKRSEQKSIPEQRLQELQEFYKEHHRLPTDKATDEKEKRLAGSVSSLISNNSKNPFVQQMIAFRDAHRPVHDIEVKWLEELKAFYAETGRLPRLTKSASPRERALAQAIDALPRRKDNDVIRQIQTFVEEHRTRPANKSTEERWHELQDFYAEHQRLPSQNSPDATERSLAKAIVHLGARKDSTDPFIQLLLSFVQEHRTKGRKRITPAL